jgi:hypothetical protein
MDCPANSNGNCVTIKTGADIPNFATQPPTTVPLAGPLFASAQGIGNTGIADTYVAPGPAVPPPGGASDFVIMARPIESDSGLNTITPLGGQTYKVSVNHDTPNVKSLPTMAVCGMHPMADVSGPASLINGPSAVPFTYCIANSAGECIAGSKAGDVYANCPNYYGQNQGCSGTEDDRGICLASNGSLLEKISQVSTTIRSGNGAEARPLTMAFHPYRVGPYYWNARVLPDGSWAVVRAPFFNKTRAEMFLAKLPPWPAPDSITRSTFVPMTVSLAPPSELNASNAIIQFGYVENGQPTDFFCTSRHEACIAAAATVSEAAPFAFAGESPAGAPCTTTCTIQIPAIPQRVVYYRVQYRDASNQVLATGTLQATAVP